MRYQTALLALSMAAGIAGCATQPTANKQMHALEMQVGQAVAIDGINTMTLLYPPAQTRLVLSNPVTNEFGSALVAGLREHGYAVMEPEVAQKTRSSRTKATGVAVPASSSGIPFSYRVSQVDPTGLYEVVLDVGSNKLARMYVLSEKRINPVGEWTRKE
jgi:type IV secretion system protein TrbH